MADNLNIRELAERLKRGPSYLLVGQAWFTGTSGSDIFLQQAVKKFGKSDSVKLSYNTFFETSIKDNTSEAVAWLHDRCTSIPIPETFEIVSEFSWNGIITSAIDDVLVRAFRKPWRDVQRITSRDYHPTDPRSRTKLHIWCLFGSVAAPEMNGWPPFDQLQFLSRKATATVLADGLPELLTSLGVLCIEGYDPSVDWLNPELLYQICSNLSPGQAHLFTSSEQHEQNPLLTALVSQGKLTLHRETLAQFLAEAEEAGRLQLGQSQTEATLGQSIRIAGHSVLVPPQILRQIQSTARLVTELAFAPHKQQSPDVRYAEFRNFLYHSSYQPDWEGYARGFAFRRSFQGDLWREVKNQVESLSLRREPIIVHGPTGSGKTVALGQLAFDLQKEGKFPLLFIDRNVNQVRREIIDQFCHWAEDQGAPAVVVIWDGMMQPKEYRGCDHYLRSRGRRCVLVGSCYQTDVSEEKPSNSVPAIAKMEDGEFNDFLTFLGHIDAALPNRLAHASDKTSDTFLGNLYRYLPETRAAIQSGLGLEVAHVEDLLLQLRIPIKDSKFGTRLGDLLTKIDLTESAESFGQATQIVGDEESTAIRRLIGFVMVAGQFGLSCPFELLIRAVGRNPGVRLLPVLERVDIFRMGEDGEGNPTVGSRSALEAKLISRLIMGGAKAEIDYVTQLLAHLRGSMLTGQEDIDFAVDLLRFLGPNGQNPAYYGPHFERLAKCLEELQTKSGLKNPRLLLQESTLLREAAKRKGNQDEGRGLLRRSIEVSTEATKILENRPVYRQMRSQFFVEIAATFGALAKSETDLKNRLFYVQQAHDHAFQAYAIDPTSHYPLDVIAWTADDLLTGTSLPDDQRLRIVESVTHAFTLADSEDWDSVAQNQLLMRRVQLGEKVFGAHLTEEAFETLLNRGSAAGVVLRAYHIGGDATEPNLMKEDRQRRAVEALEFMEKYAGVVSKDSRALFLRFKYWWLAKTGVRLNEQERFAVPFSADDWDDCVRLLAQLLAFDEFQTNLTLRLVEAVAFFHRGEYRRGFEAFQKLGTEQIFSRHRVVRRYLFSDSNGKPRRFSGTVTHVRDTKDGLISIPGFPRGLPFFVRESRKPDVRTGDDLSDFSIAFNMLGPIAEFRL